MSHSNGNGMYEGMCWAFPWMKMRPVVRRDGRGMTRIGLGLDAIDHEMDRTDELDRLASAVAVRSEEIGSVERAVGEIVDGVLASEVAEFSVLLAARLSEVRPSAPF